MKKKTSTLKFSCTKKLSWLNLDHQKYQNPNPDPINVAKKKEHRIKFKYLD